MKEIKNFINGEYVTNASGKTYENRNPVDNSLIGMVYEAGKPEVDAAVAAAKAALKGPWGKLSVVERCNMLDGLVDEINRRFDDFLQAEIADTGKPAHLASHVDIPRGAANFKIFTDTIKNVSTESFEMRTPDGKTALKSSSGSLSTVEAIAVMVGGSRRRPGSWMARSLPRRWR